MRYAENKFGKYWNLNTHTVLRSWLGFFTASLRLLLLQARYKQNTPVYNILLICTCKLYSYGSQCYLFLACLIYCS